MAYIGRENQARRANTAFKTKKNASIRNSPTYRLILMFIVILGVLGMTRQYSAEFALYYLNSILMSGLIGGLIGRMKARSMDGFCLGLVLGPLGVIIALLLKDNTRKPCPFCKESIKKTAVLCPHCHQELITKSTQQLETP